MDYCAEGLELAQQTGDRTAEASLHVTWGLNLLEMEQYDEAFRHIDLAVGILDGEARRDPCFRTWDELFYALGMKLNLLWEKDRYDEALHYIRREKQLLQETTDTVSWDYIGSHLQMELEAWQGKGDWKQASRVQSGMMALTDTLRQRERQEDALELAEIYRSNEKDREIARQEESLRRLHIVLALMAPVLVLLILYIRNILKASRIIRRKNEAMVKTIDELMARKDELFGLQEENLRLRGELQRLHAEEVTPAEEPGPTGDGEGTTAVRTLTDGDRALFERMHHEILRNRLYRRISGPKPCGLQQRGNHPAPRHPRRPAGDQRHPDPSL